MTPTLDFLNRAEREIHKLLMELRPQLLKGMGSIEHQLKDDRSVVTEMDMLTERELQRVLGQLDASIAFSGEETGVDYSKQTFWLVDPIDGTEPFIRGLPFATNMVALIDNGQPVMGIIYNFFLDEYYLAIKGRGTTCNGHAVHVSSRPLDRSYVVTVLTNSGERGTELIRNLQEKKRNKQLSGIPKAHAFGYEISAIARGAFDGAIVLGGKGAWDFAPGALLVEEAGGRIANIGADDYDYQNYAFVAGNPVIFDQLMDIALARG